MEHWIDGLKDCTSEAEVATLFSGKTFPNDSASPMMGDRISVMSAGYIHTNAYFKLDGLFNLALRAVIYLKFSGRMRSAPQNHGEIGYVVLLQKTLQEIKRNLSRDINSFGDIEGSDIDNFLIALSNSDISAAHVHRKITLLFEWVTYANSHLPLFLQINPDIFRNSKEIPLMKKRYYEDLAIKKSRLIGPKEPYPLQNLKIILSHAIAYIENYGEECLELSKYLVYTADLPQGIYHPKIHKYLRDRKMPFKNSAFLKIQNKCKSKPNYSSGKGLTVPMLRMRLMNEISIFEAACASIILMLTGMRSGELVSLERFPEVREDEYFNLSRIVYKTAATASGEKLEMPIPKIVADAIMYLSRLAEIKDGNKEGRILLTSFLGRRIHKSVGSQRLDVLLKTYRSVVGVEKMPTPHQFRHAMAFLVVHLNESDGLELARMFLGHTSIVMTLQYMGHFNLELRDAIEDLTKEESNILVDSIVEEVNNNKRLFGENGKRLMPTAQFVGKQAGEFVSLLRKGLKQLIEEKKLAIIQTPVSLCMHDLSKPEQMACQRGFTVENIIANGPAPARCKGANCSNALFFEDHIEKLKNDMYADIDPELRERLEQNTYFMDSGGFEQDPFRKLIEEYDTYKEETA